MPASYEQVTELKKSLEEEYRLRHQAFKKLRNFWHGKYWDEVDREVGGVASIFRDLTARTSDVGPDVKLVHNLLQEVCVKYQTFLSPVPMIRMYVDPPGSERSRAQANTKERYLYGVWSAGRMNKILADVGWYLPLFGHAYLGAFPDMDASMCRPILRSPENAYPVPSFDGRDTDAVIFSWEVRESALARAFPSYVRQADRNRGAYRKIVSYVKPSSSDPKVTFCEFSDKNEWARWADGQKLNGVEHQLGFNLFDEMKFINVPDEVWGHGAVEQAVNLVEMGNALYSLMFQAVLDSVFPKLVLEDPMKAPEEIETGPGAVLPLNPGGKAYYLNTPQVGDQQHFLASNDLNIKQATGMPNVNFGIAPTSSVATGKAINELQGAGTGSTVEMVQGVGIGAALVSFNEKAITQAQRMWPSDSIYLHGVMPGSIADLNPRQFGLKVKGKDLVGSPRNDVVFSPHLSMHEKIVMGLQMGGAGLVSRQWQREQVGIPDSQAMDEEILGEQIQDAVFGAILGTLDPANMDAAADAEAQGVRYLAGEKSGPVPVGNLGGAAPFPIPGAAPQALPAGMPPTAAPPPPQGAGPGAAGLSGPKAVTLDEAVAAFQTVADVQGRVFLVGEIVTQGQTVDDIEVAVTVAADKQTISAALPEFAGMLFFVDVEAEPREQFIEVTPGSDPSQGGAEPTLEELMAA